MVWGTAEATVVVRNILVFVRIVCLVCLYRILKVRMGHDGMVLMGNMNMYFFLSKEWKQRNGSIVFVLKEWGTMEW